MFWRSWQIKTKQHYLAYYQLIISWRVETVELPGVMCSSWNILFFAILKKNTSINKLSWFQIASQQTHWSDTKINEAWSQRLYVTEVPQCCIWICLKNIQEGKHSVRSSAMMSTWNQSVTTLISFEQIKTLCYINFKNWYNNCTIIFPKKSFVQEIWEAWHFDLWLTSWLMTL